MHVDTFALLQVLAGMQSGRTSPDSLSHPQVWHVQLDSLYVQTLKFPAAGPGETAAREASPLDIPRILDESLAGGVLTQAAAARLKAAGALAGSASSNPIAQYSSRCACSMY